MTLALPPRLAAHVQLQKGLLERNAIYLPAHLSGGAPTPGAWRDRPVGLMVEGAPGQQETRAFLLVPAGPQLNFQLQPTPGLVLCLSVERLPAAHELAALEQATGMPVVALTTREVRAAPMARQLDLERELKATLELGRESQQDPAESYQHMLAAIESELYLMGLQRATPVALWTTALIVLCALIFAAEELAGVPFRRWLATSAGLALGAGEPWRLLTAGLVHGGLMHVALNMYVFSDVGALLERLLGHAYACLVFWISVLGGSVLSAYASPYTSAVGASGGIFGVAGAIAAYAFLRPELPSGMVRKLGRPLLIFIAANLALGVALSAAAPISNSGHLGGLIAGLLAGALIALTAPKAAATTPEEPLPPAPEGSIVIPLRRPPGLSPAPLLALGVLTVLLCTAASTVAWAFPARLPLAAATVRYTNALSEAEDLRRAAKLRPQERAQHLERAQALAKRLRAAEGPGSQPTGEAEAALHAAWEPARESLCRWLEGWGPEGPAQSTIHLERADAFFRAWKPLR